ncbi:hypothetical protein F0562_016176 [Nyssa sinensis]|uniref:Uncharacterized protein n=1 Tax=Nyssa sinensis TaxID=561372 RepID=A0A5J4ZK36_9ASTE|nr:hypothetical protein F0562_016176 [Nyssa sinensis]
MWRRNQINQRFLLMRFSIVLLVPDGIVNSDLLLGGALSGLAPCLSGALKRKLFKHIEFGARRTAMLMLIPDMTMLVENRESASWRMDVGFLFDCLGLLALSADENEAQGKGTAQRQSL